MSKEFDQVPEYEPIQGDAGYGPGIGEELEVVTTSDILDMPICVMGFVIRDSQYENSDKYIQLEIMDKDGSRMLWNTSSQAILKKAEQRWENKQIPFRTKVVQRDNKAGSRKYNDFTN
jgi:hypothetical protein